MNAVQGLAGIVFVIIFILIGTEAINRTHAALLGAFFVFYRARSVFLVE